MIAILEMKFTETPLSTSPVFPIVGGVPPGSPVQNGTHPSDWLHPYPERFPVFGSKYTQELVGDHAAGGPTPISEPLKTIHPAC